MKKLTSILIVIVIMFTLTSCSKTLSCSDVYDYEFTLDFDDDGMLINTNSKYDQAIIDTINDFILRNYDYSTSLEYFKDDNVLEYSGFVCKYE